MEYILRVLSHVTLFPIKFQLINSIFRQRGYSIQPPLSCQLQLLLLKWPLRMLMITTPCPMAVKLYPPPNQLMCSDNFFCRWSALPTSCSFNFRLIPNNNTIFIFHHFSKQLDIVIIWDVLVFLNHMSILFLMYNTTNVKVF